ncbi:hypothetical protein ABI59_17995 [Acidobacteria bacterium Mor1]|nr:hypothetical protein ABI59_17995 [Acidobacteria bacterium Mor1]
MSGPARIVSLIASATEIVCALGLQDRLVGISHECDYPSKITGLPRLSQPKLDPRAPSADIDQRVRDLVSEGLSIYRIDVDRLQQLAPDLIVTQDQCAVCAVSLRDVENACRLLTGLECRVVSCEPHCLADIDDDVRKIAEAAGIAEAGEGLIRDMRATLDAVRQRTRGSSRPRVACVEWIDPPMIGGGWVPELVEAAGGTPLIVDEPVRFRQVTWDEIETVDPEVVVVMPCGFPIDQTRQELNAGGEAAQRLAKLKATRNGRTVLVDGNAWFNRPGPRLVQSAEILEAVLHPGTRPCENRFEIWNPAG